MAVENYVATLSLTPITDGDRTYAEWSAEFDCAPEREAELTQQIGTQRLPGRPQRAEDALRALSGLRDGRGPPEHRHRRAGRRRSGAMLRDFNGHDRWHPGDRDSADRGRRAGRHGRRGAALPAGRRRELREQLLALSDRDAQLTYCLLEAPLPLMGYVAHDPADGRSPTANATFWEWRSEFHPPEHRRDELVRLVAEGIYDAGFAAIRQLFRRPAHRPARPIRRGRGAAAGRRRRGSMRRCQPRARPPRPTRAIVVERYGGPEVLQLREVVLPP